MTRVIKRWNNLDQFTFLSPHHRHRNSERSLPSHLSSPLLSSPLLSYPPRSATTTTMATMSALLPARASCPLGSSIPIPRSGMRSPELTHPLRIPRPPSTMAISATMGRPPAPRIEPSRSLHRHTPVAFGFAPHLRRRLLSSRGHPFVRPGCIGVSSEPSSQAASQPTSQAPDSSVERSSPNKPSWQFTFIGREHGKRYPQYVRYET